MKGVCHSIFLLTDPKGPASTLLVYALQVAWLLTLSGQPFQTPQQYDDPNLTCTNILSELRQAGFAPATFAPTKLRQAHGEGVCCVLNALCDLALQKTGFSFSAPTYLAETYVAFEVVPNVHQCLPHLLQKTLQSCIPQEYTRCQYRHCITAVHYMFGCQISVTCIKACCNSFWCTGMRHVIFPLRSILHYTDPL